MEKLFCTTRESCTYRFPEQFQNPRHHMEMFLEELCALTPTSTVIDEEERDFVHKTLLKMSKTCGSLVEQNQGNVFEKKKIEKDICLYRFSCPNCNTSRPTREYWWGMFLEKKFISVEFPEELQELTEIVHRKLDPHFELIASMYSAPKEEEIQQRWERACYADLNKITINHTITLPFVVAFMIPYVENYLKYYVCDENPTNICVAADGFDEKHVELVINDFLLKIVACGKGRQTIEEEIRKQIQAGNGECLYHAKNFLGI